MPQWLEKWTALILAFTEEEQSQLPDQLLSLRLPAPSYAPLYTQAGAIMEARGEFPMPDSLECHYACILIHNRQASQLWTACLARVSAL